MKQLMVNINVYWPIIVHLYCMTSFFIRHYKLLLRKFKSADKKRSSIELITFVINSQFVWNWILSNLDGIFSMLCK